MNDSSCGPVVTGVVTLDIIFYPVFSLHLVVLIINYGMFFFSEEQLKMVCLDLLIAGSQTSSSLLGFAFLKALKSQEIQQKIYKEIDTVIGDRTPCWNDSDK